MLHLRFATEQDAPALAAIYRPYVETTSVSFEYKAPSDAEFSARIHDFSAFFPYLVWEQDGKPLGYAYAHRVAAREAYQWGAELSVYLAPEATRRGIGSALYRAMLSLLKEQGILVAYACITRPNAPSDALHAAFGFTAAGIWKNAGFKQGAWHDVGWFQKPLAPLPEHPAAPVSVHSLPAARVARILEQAERPD